MQSPWAKLTDNSSRPCLQLRFSISTARTWTRLYRPSGASTKPHAPLRQAATARRKVLYEELHPETRHGGDHSKASRKDCDLLPTNRFTADTASKTGRSERSGSPPAFPHPERPRAGRSWLS
jgi:hypothetical protein